MSEKKITALNRWSIFIDVEGFSKIYSDREGKAYKSLGALIRHIYEVGTKVYLSYSDSLFVHQIGDGFIIVSLANEKDINRAISISCILMRQLLLQGYMSKAAISIGDFADISGCYPNEISKLYQKSETIQMGHGLLRIFPVMGSTLINSFKLGEVKSGPNLLIDSQLKENIQMDRLDITEATEKYLQVNWLTASFEEIERVAEILSNPLLIETELLKEIFRQYLDANPLKEQWLKEARKHLS